MFPNRRSPRLPEILEEKRESSFSRYHRGYNVCLAKVPSSKVPFSASLVAYRCDARHLISRVTDGKKRFLFWQFARGERASKDGDDDDDDVLARPRSERKGSECDRLLLFAATLHSACAVVCSPAYLVCTVRGLERSHGGAPGRIFPGR